LTRAREEVRTTAMTLATQAEVVHNMMRRELAAG
jgi:propanediol dehydratase small subunit